MNTFTPTDRSRAKRLHQRAHYDQETIHGLLDTSLLCHVGYVIDGQPYVTPTCHWREGKRVYWHGSSASRMLRNVKTGIPVCLTIAHLDGLVMARSGMHHSANYRSAMLFGTAHAVEDPDEKAASLKAFVDRLTPGRWEELRPMTAQELKATTVIGMDIEDAVAKIRTGPPVDDEKDYDAVDCWAGVVPITMTLGQPEDDPRLRPGISVPGYIRSIVVS